MSFYTCNRSGACPGVMSGNPLNGICEKACIQVDKVLDAAMRQIQQTNVQVVLTNQNPENPVSKQNPDNGSSTFQRYKQE